MPGAQSPGIDHARGLLQGQDWAAAAQAFEAVLKQSPGDAAAHFGLSVALENLGQTSRAISEARHALRLRPGFEEARLALGLMLQRGGDTAAATAEYREVLRRNPKSAEAHNWLGVVQLERDQLTEAVASFRTAIRLKPDFIRAHNNLGSALAQTGQLDQGVAAFREGLRHAPGDLRLNLNLGSALRNQGDAPGALEQFRKVLEGSPEDPEVHYQIGQTHRQQGALTEAVQAFLTALRLNPEYREAYYILGQTLRQQAAAAQTAPATDAARVAARQGLEQASARNLTAAVASLTQAVMLEPAAAELHYHLGAALWYSGERARAAQTLDEALRLNPAAAPAASLRALIARESGDLDRARQLLQQAMAVEPRLAGAYFDLAVVLLRQQRTAAALAQFEAGLNLDATAAPGIAAAAGELRAALTTNDSAEGRHILARLMGLAGATPQSVAAEFTNALRLRPNFPEAHNHLGLVHLQAGEDPRAIAAFREAIRLKPEFADAHANLGSILTATDAAASVRELELALKLQPDHRQARFNLALAYGASPRHGVEHEITQLRKLHGEQPDDARINFALGRALLRKGLVPEAIQRLERAVQINPAYGEAQYQLGLALARAGRHEEASRTLKEARAKLDAGKLEQTIVLDLNEAKAAYEAGNFEHALAKFKQVAAQRPDLTEPTRYIAMIESRGINSPVVRGDDPNPQAARGDDPNQMQQFERAIRDNRFTEVEPQLRAYVAQRPNSSWGWYALGYSLFAQKRIGDSITALAKSLSLNVKNADAHLVLGRNLMMIGRFDAAQVEFEQGEKYDPKSASYAYNLGKLFSIQDRWVQARQAFERSLALDPASMEAHDGLGFALEALGDDQAAIASYTRAIELNDQRKAAFATPAVNLSALHNRAGNPAKAIEYARKALAVNRGADGAWYQMARAQERQGELEPALESVREAIAINGRVSSYHYTLAGLCRRLGKPAEAREALEIFSRLEKETTELEQKRREAQRP
ncbi:MAG: tetratricopeptide repeat protein [Acidobacteria bacterium]|nr:tetratricopeptide repeat protein [Acidobacteriota bacterium]